MKLRHDLVDDAFWWLADGAITGVGVGLLIVGFKHQNDLLSTLGLLIMGAVFWWEAL